MKCRGKPDTTWNIPPRSRFPCYISCYIAESRLHLGQCRPTVICTEEAPWAQPGMDENFPNWCGNISSLVGTFFVSGVEFFRLYIVWKFSFCSYPKVQKEIKLNSTSETKKIHNRDKNVHTRDKNIPHQRQKIATPKTTFFNNRTEKWKKNWNAGVEIFTKQLEQYPFPEKRNYKRNIYCNYNNFYFSS